MGIKKLIKRIVAGTVALNLIVSTLLYCTPNLPIAVAETTFGSTNIPFVLNLINQSHSYKQQGINIFEPKKDTETNSDNNPATSSPKTPETKVMTNTAEGISIKHESNMPVTSVAPEITLTPTENPNQRLQTPAVTENPNQRLQTPAVTENSQKTAAKNEANKDFLIKPECLPYENTDNTLTEVTCNQNNSEDNNTKSDEENGYDKEGKPADQHPIKNKSRNYNIGFSNYSSESMLRFAQGKSTITLGPTNAAKSTGKAEKNTILYESIYPNIDLRYTAEDYRLKEDIILNKLTKQNEFTFQLNIDQAEYKIEDDGTISFTETGALAPSYYIAKPYALDKDGNHCEQIKQELSKEGLLKLTVDEEWLKTAVYPVTIDPTIYLSGCEIYQASNLFSGTQGQNYFYYEEQRADGNYYSMNWDSAQTCWVGSTANTLIGTNWQQPETNNAVRTWRAPHSGTITITGTCQSATGTGDGINIMIVKNTTQAWPSSGWQYVAANNPSGVSISQSITVNAGDYIRFIVNANTTNTGDRTNWDPVITYINGLSSSATFYRSSIAYNADATQVSVNTPRYETGKYGNALKTEEGAINLLTENQSSTETDLLGWGNQNATLTRVTGGYNGNYSMQCNLNAGDSWVGFTGLANPITAYNPTGTRFSFKFYAKGQVGKQINLSFNDGTITGNSPNYALTEDWQLFSYAFNISNAAIYFSVYVKSSDGTAQILNLDACKVEWCSTNLLTENQSSAETDLTGWDASYATISRVNGGWHGDYAVQCTLSESYSRVGFANIPYYLGGDYFNFSFYAKGTAGKRIRIYATTGGLQNNSPSFTLTDTWQRYNYSFRSNGSVTAYLGGDAQTFYVDGCQFERNEYASSWVLGSTHRTSETLTIPTAGVINATKGSVEVSAYIDPSDHNCNINPGYNQSSTLFAVVDNQKQNGISLKSYYSAAVDNEQKKICYVEFIKDGVSSGAGIGYMGYITSPGWYTFTVTGQTGTGAHAYINGVKVRDIAATYLPLTLTAPAAYVGSWIDGTGHGARLIDDLRISNRMRTDAEILTAYQSNQPLPVDEATTCKMNFDNNLQMSTYTQSAPDTVHFIRNSNAYKQDGILVAEGTTRNETGKFGTALMVEEGTTNLLTANQSSAETNIGDWSTGGAQNAVISRVSSGWHGSYAVQGTLNAGDSWIGYTGVPFTAGSTYTFSVYAKGIQGNQIKLCFNDGVTEGCSQNFNLFGNWQRFSYTFTIGAGATALSTYIRDAAGTGQTLYLDGGQVEQKPFATSWIVGGIARTGETMTVPTAGVINASQGSIEVYAYIDPLNVHSAGNPNSSTLIALADVQALPYLEKNQISIRRQPSTTNWYAYFANDSGNMASINLGNIITAGWYHFALTWQAGVGGYAYLNGVSMGSVAAANLPKSITSSKIYLGSWVDGTGQLDQLIDDLRIYSRLRTAAEILADYQSNQALPVDTSTTCKMYFDDNPNPVAGGTEGTGIEPYWNYVKRSLGGGLDFSVNTNNLNMVLTKSLYQIPGRGIPIGESITYNSQDHTIGVMGLGWHMGADINLIEKSDGSVIYTGGDGAIYQFTPDGSGGYINPPGIYVTLQKELNGFKITDKKQNIYNYSTGKPIEIKDPNSNVTTYEYDANGRLSKFRDPSGRTMMYSYNSAGQLSTVQFTRKIYYYGTNDYYDQVVSTYTLAYLNGRLISLTDPENKIIMFSYDSYGYLKSITDPLSRVTTFSFNSEGKLESYNDARTNGADIYQTTFVQTMLNGQVVTTVTDPGNRVNTYYSNPTTGNLIKLVDGVGNTWEYTWSNNNLISSQDAKGTTTYQYDSRGNVTGQTTTVDNNLANNITKTMTYDTKDQLTREVDGSGRITDYRYDEKGNLISTDYPDLKISTGNVYNSFGGITQISPFLSTNQNLLKNGSFEYAYASGLMGDLSNWIRVPGNAAVATEMTNYVHGNYALKMSSSTVTTDWYYQRVTGISLGDKLTLRADVTLDNIINSGGTGGATIKLVYGSNWESWSLNGTGKYPMVVTSQCPNSNGYVDAYIGLNNTSGTAWFDGVQLEKAYNTGEGYISSAYDSIENGGFENDLTKWNKEAVDTPLTIATDVAGEGTKSAKLTLSTKGIAKFYQYVPTYAGETLTISALVKTNNVSGGDGAYISIGYFNNGEGIGGGVQTVPIQGTKDFTRIAIASSAPTSNAYCYAQISVVLDGTGTAYFDAFKIVPRITQRNVYDSDGNYVKNTYDAIDYHNMYQYNDSGSIISYVDGLNHQTPYTYDNLNRLTRVLDASANIYAPNYTYYNYDGVSNLIATRDPRSASVTDNTYLTGFTPTNLNQSGTITDPLTRVTTNTYDRSGNLISTLLPNGTTLTFTYDNANRLLSRTLDNGRTFTYTYDGANDLLSVTDQDNNTYSWTYDGAKRVTSSSDPNGYTLAYQWDKSNNLLSVTSNNPDAVNYQYGSTNRLLTVTLPDSTIIEYNYDENGRVFQIRNPGTNNLRNMYYLGNGWINRIQDQAFPNGVDYAYTYLANGNISQIKSWAGSDNLTYDALNRLTSWAFTPTNGTAINESYTYDKAGNILTKVFPLA